METPSERPQRRAADKIQSPDRVRSADRAAAYRAIDGERDYQDWLWQELGSPGTPNQLTIGEFILLAEEYLEKARKVWTQEPKPEKNTLHKLRKVAGILVNCMEQHGAPHRSTTQNINQNSAQDRAIG